MIYTFILKWIFTFGNIATLGVLTPHLTPFLTTTDQLVSYRISRSFTSSPTHLRPFGRSVVEHLTSDPKIKGSNTGSSIKWWNNKKVQGPGPNDIKIFLPINYRFL